jgi:hypothetical protein
VRYDDLELICRDDSQVRRFRQFHVAQMTRPSARPRQRQPVRSDEPQKPHAYASPVAWIMYRVELAGEWWVEREGGFYFFPCPEHPHDGALACAQMFGSAPNSFVRLSCVRECLEDSIMDGYCIPATELFPVLRCTATARSSRAQAGDVVALVVPRSWTATKWTRLID